MYKNGEMEKQSKKLQQILQKRAVRIINNKRYRSHTDPIFKSENILKIADIHKLHVSLFMYDYLIILANIKLHLIYSSMIISIFTYNSRPVKFLK